MNALRSFARTFPAFTWALSLAIGSSVATWLVLLLVFRSGAPTIFLLGDSCTGNYRLDPGGRMEDRFSAELPGWKIRNWGMPGASPLDFYLQYDVGRMLCGKPRAVVINLAADKFVGNREFDEDGRNLRFIDWGRSGRELFSMLSPHFRNVAVVQQASLALFAPVDVLRSLWIKEVQWPWERHAMRNAGPDRARRIAERCRQSGLEMESFAIDSDSGFAAHPLARNAEFLIRSLREHGVPTQVVILPFANPDLVARHWSPKALANRDLFVARMRTWLQAHQVAYVDFNEPQRIAHFPGALWDDDVHVKDPAAYTYIAKTLRARFTSTNPTGPQHGNAATPGIALPAGRTDAHRQHRADR